MSLPQKKTSSEDSEYKQWEPYPVWENYDVANANPDSSSAKATADRQERPLRQAQGRPNILWITCEDISPYLGCYGVEQALTPNLDKLAEQGVRYTRAYAATTVAPWRVLPFSMGCSLP